LTKLSKVPALAEGNTIQDVAAQLTAQIQQINAQINAQTNAQVAQRFDQLVFLVICCLGTHCPKPVKVKLICSRSDDATFLEIGSPGAGLLTPA
jgi:hypothetical protein